MVVFLYLFFTYNAVLRLSRARGKNTQMILEEDIWIL